MMTVLSVVMLVALVSPAALAAIPGVSLPGGGDPIGNTSQCANGLIPKANNGIWECSADTGAGTGAPTTSTYITQTPDGTLSAEQALSALPTGLLRSTTTTGVLSSYAGAACTNQVLEDLDPSGAPTCVSISSPYITDGTITEADVNAANKDGVAGVPGLRTLGTGAQQAAPGNDARFPTAGEKAALAGSSGSPGGANVYVTATDPSLPGLTIQAALSATSQITCTDRTIAVASTGGDVTLTNASPIVAGTFAGQRCTLKGSHASNRVLINNGSTLRLCGNTGTLTLGLNAEQADFEWTGAEWSQDNCLAAQRVFSTGRTVSLGACGAAGAPTAGNPVWGDLTGGHYTEFCLDTGNLPTTKSYCSGALCDTVLVAPVGKDLNILSGPDTLVNLDEATDTWDFAAGHVRLRGGTGAPTGADCDAAAEARRTWIQTDASAECMVWTCRGAAGWANQCGTKAACLSLTGVSSADDDQLFPVGDKAITVKSVWCIFRGAAYTTAPTFVLDGMTHGGTSPTCAASSQTTGATKLAVTAGNSVVANGAFEFSVTNSPNPTDKQTVLCVGYDVN